MHDRPGFTRKIDSCHIHQPELTEILVEIIHAQPEPDINKYWIAGVLNPLYEGLRPMSTNLMAPNLPILHHPVTGTAKLIFQLHGSRFKTCGCGDDFER